MCGYTYSIVILKLLCLRGKGVRNVSLTHLYKNSSPEFEFGTSPYNSSCFSWKGLETRIMREIWVHLVPILGSPNTPKQFIRKKTHNPQTEIAKRYEQGIYRWGKPI